jgi:predicted enzyme related to lactoylglutathione lyase
VCSVTTGDVTRFKVKLQKQDQYTKAWIDLPGDEQTVNVAELKRERGASRWAPRRTGCHVRRSHPVMGVVTTTHRRNPVFEKVFYTSVMVSDQDRALDFYTNVLGLEKRVENPTPDGPRFLTVGVKDDDFQLVLWPGTPGQAQPVMGRPPASITIETDDIRDTVEELESHGVEFVSDVLEFPWGFVAQFQDPDGNLLQIREGR